MNGIVKAFVALVFFNVSCQNQETTKTEKPLNTTEITDESVKVKDEIMESNEFDSIMAKKLGADEYGMKQYVMAILKTGPNKSENKEEAQKLQRAHLDNITRMANEGSLVLAGPFLGSGEMRGIYVFNVKTIKEAEELTKTDPMIEAGVLVFEFYPWYGSAALQLINEQHTKIAKVAI